MRRFINFSIGPLLGYAVCYAILTFPLILQFPRAYFCDDGDGLQTIWNVWWVKFAVTRLHQAPFFTPMFHQPAGAWLWLHSLTPINGLIGLLFSPVLGPITTFNALVLLAFAGTGLTTFWLAWDQTRRYWPSLAAGYAFAFCEYRFAHAAGHLSLISSQFFPLYVLLLLRTIRTAHPAYAAGAAGVLGVLLLTDHYQFIYAGMLGGLLVVGNIRTLASLRFARVAIAFALVFALTSGPMLWSIWRLAREPIYTWHDPQKYSADLLNLFVPGVAWQFHGLTQTVWHETGQYVEKSVAISLAVLGAALAARSNGRFRAGQWWTIAIVFSLLSLGPTLQIFDRPITSCMPYRLLNLVPLFNISGCPARMVSMTSFALSILAAGGLARLGSPAVLRRRPVRAAMAVAFVIAMVLQSEPHIQASVLPTTPQWVFTLRDLPVPGPIIDLRSEGRLIQYYYQTVHHRPMAFGELSRRTQSMEAADQSVRRALTENHFGQLRSMGFVYLVQGASSAPLTLPAVYEDREVRIYTLSAAVPAEPN